MGGGKLLKLLRAFIFDQRVLRKLEKMKLIEEKTPGRFSFTQSRETIIASPEEELYCLNCDLFKV